MPTLIVIRHGNTFNKGDVLLRVGSRTDIPLSSSGRKQVSSLAEHLAAIYPEPHHVYSGALLRQQETADIISNAYMVRPPATIGIDILQEIDYGEDDGLPEDSVIAKHGQDTLNRWERDNVIPAGWKADPHVLREGWKTFAAFLLDHYPKDAVIMAVTSNGTARFAPEALLSAAKQPEQRKLHTGAYGVFLCHSPTNIECNGWNIKP